MAHNLTKMGHDLPTPGTTLRLLGRGPRAVPGRQIGCGVIDKSNLKQDHAHFRAPGWSVVWVLRGAGSYEDEHGKIWSITAGDCFQRWPGRLHSTSMVPGSGWLEIFIDLGDELARTLGELGMLNPNLVVWRLGDDAARLRRWLDLRTALTNAADHDLPHLCIEAQSLALAAVSCANPVIEESDPVALACRLLAEDPAFRDDLRSFCRRMKLDYEAFRKRFRRHTGMSPGQYRIRRRMERACALIKTTTLPIAAIASQLGYASPFVFSTQFRSHFGISPLSYRKP